MSRPPVTSPARRRPHNARRFAAGRVAHAGHVADATPISRIIHVIAGAAVGALIAAGHAAAHGDAEWIMRGLYRHPHSGELCCGPEDCFVVPAGDVAETDAGWRIISTGELIPRGEAQKSRDGDFWRCQRADGSRRCWFYPVPGS